MLILDDRRVKDGNDIRMSKPPVGFDFPHRFLVGFVPGVHENLFQGISTIIRLIADEIHEPRCAFSQQLLNGVGPTIDLQIGISVLSVTDHHHVLTVCICTRSSARSDNPKT